MKENKTNRVGLKEERKYLLIYYVTILGYYTGYCLREALLQG